ncbi:uncharacterized protein BO80DRAFT_476883 [Aspergillus ibericus CBS 121593]|uniref:SRR1-like domain-containing protein n=1 Tax=Aspergillus ibericus CBS 121593 TaxID=1448316 RepID=A0A395GWI9_9EURO|nr:hypothetical protein BO80DRAFT_476883 [Aspergillus ibericus CBS 121593]RAK99906.1 hypothetical protein BO80DRAFT_476883 [Aspergillus ibericus CBS 121593]
MTSGNARGFAGLQTPQTSCFGRPLLTKDALRNVQQQLSSPLREGDKIRIIGYDGVKVKWEPLGKADMLPDEEGLEYYVVSLLERDAGGTAEHKLPCYIQDPAYNEIDKEALTEHGMQVVNDPQGYLEVDESSVVFSCASNVAVKEIITELARPAIIIWVKVEESDIETGDEPEDDFYASTDPVTPRVFDMLRNCYNTYAFLPDTNFCEMAVYVRK